MEKNDGTVKGMVQEKSVKHDKDGVGWHRKRMEYSRLKHRVDQNYHDRIFFCFFINQQALVSFWSVCLYIFLLLNRNVNKENETKIETDMEKVKLLN